MINLLVFLPPNRDRFRQARAARRLRRPGADGHRRGPDRNLPATFSPGTADVREGGRRQQLRQRSLHRREGDR